jgi:hypothetical protein
MTGVARAVAVAMLLVGCATAKDRARAVDEYVKNHPTLTHDDVDRMRHREARVGDALAQVELAWQGAIFEHMPSEGAMAKQATLDIYQVRLPIGCEPTYLESEGGHREVQLVEDGSVFLTFEQGKLARWQVVSKGNLTTGM